MIRPLRDKVLVKPIPRIKSHLIEVVGKENPSIGKVVAVGPGDRDKKGRLQPNPIEVGQIVRYGTYAEYLKYTEVEVDGEPHLLMSWKDIVFIEVGDAQDHQ